VEASAKFRMNDLELLNNIKILRLYIVEISWLKHVLESINF
jgi:hypothetical protein